MKQFLAGGTLLLIAPAALTSCEKSDPDDGPGGNNNNNNNNNLIIDLSGPEYAALVPAGGSIVKSGIIVINLGSDNFVAFSAICTHQGCTVGFNSSTGNIHCPCHFSVFNTSGAVLEGPASSPLPRFTLTKSGNILTIIR